MVLKKLIFNSVNFGLDMVVLKELILNNLYDFEEDVVVLKEISFNSFYFGRTWCESLERTEFYQFSTFGRM